MLIDNVQYSCIVYGDELTASFCQYVKALAHHNWELNYAGPMKAENMENYKESLMLTVCLMQDNTM